MCVRHCSRAEAVLSAARGKSLGFNHTQKYPSSQSWGWSTAARENVPPSARPQQDNIRWEGPTAPAAAARTAPSPAASQHPATSPTPTKKKRQGKTPQRDAQHQHRRRRFSDARQGGRETSTGNDVNQKHPAWRTLLRLSWGAQSSAALEMTTPWSLSQIVRRGHTAAGRRKSKRSRRRDRGSE